MLKSANRLKNKKDFLFVYRSRLRAHFPEIAIQWTARKNNQLPSRFGIVVSNKISKKAVEKNRAKRLLREVIRNLIKQGNAPAGFDCVVSGKILILGAEYNTLYGMFYDFFKKQKSSINK